MAKDEVKKDIDKNTDKKGSEDAEQQAAPRAAKSNKKLILIVGGLVGLLILLGFPVMFLMLREKGGKHAASDGVAMSEEAHPDEKLIAEGSTDEDELGEEEEALGAIFPFDTFVVNLKGGSYLRAQIQVEFVDRDIPRRFYTRLTPTRDALITLLTNKAVDDLNTVEGKETLKREVKDIINEILRKEEVRNVYFTQFVLQ